MNKSKNNKQGKNKEDTTLTTKSKTVTYKVKGKEDGFFVESVVIDGKPSFIAKELGKESYKIIPQIEKETYIIKPCLPEHLAYKVYSFSKEEFETLVSKPVNREELLDEIYSITNRFIHAKEEYKILIAIDIFMSYAQDHISTVHYPYAVGETESGKSSVLHLVKNIGYRPLYGEGINKANVYNFFGLDEEGSGIVLEDEAQEMYHDKAKINLYKNSYAKGSKFPVMVGWDGKNKRQLYYLTFGQKWFAGEYIPQDKGFSERLAKMYMISGKTEGNIKKPTDDEKKLFEELRKKLLIWKLQNIDKELPKINSGLKQRDQELWEDFIAISFGTTFYERAKKVVSYFIAQRQESIQNSREAYLFGLVMEEIDDKFEIDFESFWRIFALKEGNSTDCSAVTSGEYGNVSKNILSKIFVEKFQATKVTRNERNGKNYHKITSYQFNKDVCKTLYEKYLPDLSIDHPLLKSGQSGQKHEFNEEG